MRGETFLQRRNDALSDIGLLHGGLLMEDAQLAYCTNFRPDRAMLGK